jgi:hypothetical protein
MENSNQTNTNCRVGESIQAQRKPENEVAGGDFITDLFVIGASALAVIGAVSLFKELNKSKPRSSSGDRSESRIIRWLEEDDL